jgi:glycosyltransferase involved in cell wall biosynthesis
MNFGGLVGARLNIPFLVHEHFVDQRYPLVQRPFDWFLAPRTSLAIAVSHSVEEFMYRRGFSAGRLRLIYNGAPLQTFRPSDEESIQRERRRLGIPAGAVVVGTVGRLDKIKGNEYAIQAIAELTARGFRDLWLLVVGDGPCLAALRSQARESGLADRIVFSGFRVDIPLLQSVMDIQVFPSLSEGSPLTMFEAMSMGKAIVATNVGGLGEILKDNETAILVEPADGVLLANAIERLLKDPALAEKLAHNGNRVAQQHDISQVIDELQEIYIKHAARTGQNRS